MTTTGIPDINVIAAVFVTYQPDLALLERAICSIARQVGALYVVDNGSSNIKDIFSLCYRNGATLLSLGSNCGIACAYNRAFDWAKSHGCSWVITCDQDSVMPDDMISRFLGVVGSCEQDEDLGIVCPNFIYRTTGQREYGYDFPIKIDKCISSGALTSVDAWQMVGGFDEAMFIDGVDFDFCKRLRDAGWSILLVPDVCIEHEIGDVRIHRVFGHQFQVFNHSAFRKYYIAQNIVYISGKYHGGKPESVAYLKVLKQLLLVLFYEKDKQEKITSIMRGARHGRELLDKRTSDK